jgi:microcystin-dependent protein
MEEYMGIVKLFAGAFAPRDWMFCYGQLLSINEYQALYSLLGTYFGGDGRNTFGLPDLRSKVPIGAGQSLGLTNYILGQVGGVEAVTLSLAQMPVHNHTGSVQGSASSLTASVTVNAGTAGTATNNPTGAYWGQAANVGVNPVKPYTNAKNATMASDAVAVQLNGNIQINSLTIGNNGGSLPHENRQPFQALNYIICVNGLYPPRN